MDEEDWSLERLYEEDEKAAAKWRPRPALALSFFQKLAVQALHGLRIRYAEGDKFALMLAIYKCAKHDLPIPPWVALGYGEGFERVWNYETASWDEAFGRTIPKGAHLSSLRFRHENESKLIHSVEARVLKGVSLDDELFEEVATMYGIGITLVKDLYYSHKKRR